MRYLSTLVVTVVVACGAAACGQSSTDDASEPSAPARPSAPVAPAGDGRAYPAIYRDLGLPEIDGGTVTDTGRQTSSLRDGVIIALDSPKTVDEARAYYAERLAAAGWTISPAGRGGSVPNLPMGMVEATKDRLHYQATIMARPDGGTQIRIGLREN